MTAHTGKFQSSTYAFCPQDASFSRSAYVLSMSTMVCLFFVCLQLNCRVVNVVVYTWQFCISGCIVVTARNFSCKNILKFSGSVPASTLVALKQILGVIGWKIC